MSAAFKFNEYACWGTNGTIEAYLECLCRLSNETPDSGSELLPWLKKERDAFYPGTVVFLDTILADPAVAWEFLALFELATQQLIAGDEFTEMGQQWLQSEPPKLRGCIFHALHGVNSVTKLPR